MRKIVNLFKKINTRAKAIVTALLVTAVAGGAVYAGFTPADRPTYDYNKGSDSSNCLDPNDPGFDHGRCGSLNGPVFDSFINVPGIGDERAFFDASLTGSNGSYKDVLPSVTSGATDGTRIVTLRTYVHNNANQNTNASSLGVAHDTKVRITLPTGTDKMLRARSYIDAKDHNNNAVQEVTDTTELVDSTPFSVSYVPDSAVMYNASTGAAGTKLSDSIVTDGALVGGEKDANGVFKGCFDFKTTVEIKVRVNVANFDFQKMVRKAGDIPFVDKITAKPGDRIQYKLLMSNTGKATLDNVKFRDVLPPHMTLNAGSVTYSDPVQNAAPQGDKPLFDGGIIAPSSIGSGAFSYIRFSTTLKDDFEGCEVTVRNLAYDNSTQFPAEKEGHADVVIKKENCTPPVPQVFCDSLTAPKLDLMTGESTVFTAVGHVVNTTISGYTFKVNGQVVQDTASNTYNFTQNAEGSYTVSVTVKSPAGNVTSAGCTKTVTVHHENVPVVTCDSLSALSYSLKEGESTLFTAIGHATNTTISGYTFKVNGQVVQDTASNTYTFTQNTEGTYTIAVTVKSPAGNVTSEACIKTVHVQKEITPVYSCDATTFSKSNLLTGESFTTTVRYTASGGATFKQAIFNFGDNTSFTTNTSANNLVSANHSYAAKNTYAITVRLEFLVNGQTKVVEGGNCVGQVTVTNEKCKVPGKEQFDKNDTVHCNDVKGVTTLPNTGAGNVIGLFAAVTAAGAFLHSVWTRRVMNR